MPGILRVGIWDKFWRKFGRDPDPSITHYQPAPRPHGLEWVDLCDDPSRVDVVMAGWGSEHGIVDSLHPRKVMYLQETSEAYGPSAGCDLESFDLVLSNDQAILNALPNRSRHMTLFGIRMPPAHYAVVPEKRRNVSLMGSHRTALSGHVLRWQVHRQLAGFDRFGFDGVPYWKSASLGEYRFQICIENSNYRDWVTEKLWDAFALETVPIYWGGVADEKLEEWGFRADGIIRWSGDLDELPGAVDAINASPEESYARFRDAVAHNRRRVLELPCGEVTLRSVLCDYFGFEG
jgi:hypothetical protein